MECVEVVGCGLGADLVFGEQRGELLAVDERDGCGVGAGCFGLGAFAEVACGDDQTLFVCSERAAHLLDSRCLDVVFPAFCLHGHADAHRVGYCEGAAHVDAAVFGGAGDVGVFEADRSEQLPDEVFELGGGGGSGLFEKLFGALGGCCLRSAV